MNISGLRSPLAAAYGLGSVARPTAPAAPAAPAASVQTAGALARTADVAEMPKGANPELWSVLTGDEKAFFARQASLGPLTYGPGARARSVEPAALQAPRGQRLDVSA